MIIQTTPQLLVKSLKVVPWNYGEGTSKTSDSGEILPKNNPLYLPDRVIKLVKKASVKIPEEKTKDFLEKMGHQDIEVVKQLEEVPL